MADVPTPSMQSVTEAGRVLQAPGGKFFSDSAPQVAAVKRAIAIYGTVNVVAGFALFILSHYGVIDTEVVTAAMAMLNVLTRMWEGSVDQGSVVSP